MKKVKENKVFEQWCRQAKSGGIRRFWARRWWKWRERGGVTRLRRSDHKARWRKMLKSVRGRRISREYHARLTAAINAPSDTAAVAYAAAALRALAPGTRCVTTGNLLWSVGLLRPAGDRADVWLVQVCECELCATGRFVCCVGGSGERRTFAKAALRPERLDQSRDESPAWLCDARRAGLHKGMRPR